ncbi:MAG: hypothetical protein JO043_13565 [Candidatus Eremiobacteraeota bacterium]|nr:hypothetical protein [Candidatus Eremiobacteraeota bacterium]
MKSHYAALVLAALGFGASSLQAAAMPAPRLGGVHPVAAVHRAGIAGGAAVVGHLHHIVTIGSTVDPQNGDQNPYGLMIAPSTSGLLTQGDLVVCNFNDNLNIQGLGTTIVFLHPTPGASPQRFVQDGRLTGCNALATSPGDAPWAAAFTANDNPFYDSTGNLIANLAGAPLAQPWGQAFSGTKGPYGVAAFYTANAADGSIVRFGIRQNSITMKAIASGFPVNHGVPGTALAPSGLTYDASDDTLYFADGDVNAVYAFHNVSLIPPHGITVGNNGRTFSGVAGSLAEMVFHGSPLGAPISMAQLFNGNLVIGNTTNNDLIELNPARHAVVSMRNLDHHAVGALFGIAATGTSASNTQIFFNDDNDNTVKVLQP